MTLQVGITRHESEKAWFLVTNNTTHVIGVTNDGLVISLYWGARLTSTNDIAFPIELAPERSSQDPSVTSAFEAYPVFGGLRFGPQVLKVAFSDGTRELDLAYSTSQHTKRSLSISFKDKVHEFFGVQLVYELDMEHDMISCWPVLRNHSQHETVSVSKFQSGAWHIPAALDTQRRLVTLAGAWCQETQMQQHSVAPGTSHLLQSTRGIPSAQAYPYFAILEQSSEQALSDVYFGTIEWSGNWSIEIQTNIQGNTTIIGGINERDFGWTLGPLESTAQWKQPFTVGYAKGGMAEARTLMTRYVASSGSKQLNPVLYNGWEVYGAGVTIENQIKVATHAAKLGVELFVLDDGWFKGRSSDNAGLGDWYVDKTKFPDGLKPLSDKVHALGMKFGLWFEPEMVNPDSDLYRAHPDWIYYYPDYERYEERNQLVLNITKHEVQEYIVERMVDIIASADVDYIKWDMNRPISEAGSNIATGDKDPKEVWVKHVLTVYSIIRRLKREFPHLLIESCCSGGGRADVGILKEVDMCWPSDNTRPDARLLIQHGASCIIPPRFMSCWVTDSPNDDPTLSLIPISFRFHVSFMGTLGLGMNIEKHSRSDLEQYGQWIDVYKKIRHIMQLGDLTWLVPPTANAPSGITVTQTTVRDQTESVVLAFRQSSPFWMALPAIKLQRLDNEAIYTLCIWHTDPLKPAFTGEQSGAYLMGKGLELPYLTSKAYSSVVVWLKKKEGALK
ncbi:glycoside hydrolase family 36 protein, partial [Backusella circina FSU 941]